MLPKQKITFKYVQGKGSGINLYERQLVFTHIPKAAGTTLDWIMKGISEYYSVEHLRLPGTIYGQFLGADKPNAITSLNVTSPDKLKATRFLIGHLPTTAWDEILLDKEAAFITILRDPIERMISHYKFGLKRGGWQACAKPDELVRNGLLVDNPQVRQISGCRDPFEPCTEVMLETALQTLFEQYVLVGLAENFDTMLSTLIMSCGWPDVIYSSYNTGTLNLNDDKIAVLKKECRPHNHFDQLLVDAVKTHDTVLFHHVYQKDPPPVEETIIIVAEELKDKNGDFPSIPKTELGDFEKWVLQKNVNFLRV